jgi:biotin operon repressor
MKRETEEMAQFAVRVLAHIQLRDYTHPVNSDELEAVFGVKERQITQAIEYLRDSGHKVASSKGRHDRYLGVYVPPGFYIARRPEEMRSTADMLQSTIQRISERRRRLMDFGNAAPSLYEQGDAA